MTAKSQQVRQLLSNASCSPDVVNTVANIVGQMEKENTNLLSMLAGVSRTLNAVRKGRDLLVTLLAEKGAVNE